jgi:hypothetical protein
MTASDSQNPLMLSGLAGIRSRAISAPSKFKNLATADVPVRCVPQTRMQSLRILNTPTRGSIDPHRCWLFARKLTSGKVSLSQADGCRSVAKIQQSQSNKQWLPSQPAGRMLDITKPTINAPISFMTVPCHRDCVGAKKQRRNSRQKTIREVPLRHRSAFWRARGK